MILQTMKLGSKQNHFIVGSIFAIYHVLVPLDFIFNFVPFLPDSILYNFMFETGLPPVNYSKSLVGFFTIISFLRVLLMHNILAYISFQIFLYFVSVFIILKSWDLLYKHQFSNTFNQFFLIIALLLPSSLLYNIVPLRECFSTFAFAVTLYYLTLLFKKSSVINTGFLSGLFMVIFTRMQVAIYFLLSFLGLKVAIDKNIGRKFLVTIVGLILFAGFIAYSNYQLSPEKLQWARNYRVNNYTPSYGNVSWKSYGDILKSTPTLGAQFLLSPLPIMHNLNPGDFKLALLDAMLVLIILAVVFLNIKNIVKNHLYWFLLILFYLILFGIYEFGIIGAVRHRLPLTILLIALAANQLTTLFTKHIKETEVA